VIDSREITPMSPADRVSQEGQAGKSDDSVFG